MLSVVQDDTVGGVGHVHIFIVALDLLIILKAEEILKFREVLLMSRYKIVHIVDSISWDI